MLKQTMRLRFYRMENSYTKKAFPFATDFPPTRENIRPLTPPPTRQIFWAFKVGVGHRVNRYLSKLFTKVTTWEFRWRSQIHAERKNIGSGNGCERRGQKRINWSFARRNRCRICSVGYIIFQSKASRYARQFQLSTKYAIIKIRHRSFVISVNAVNSKCSSTMTASVDNILNFDKGHEDYYAILGCDETSTVSEHNFLNLFANIRSELPMSKSATGIFLSLRWFYHESWRRSKSSDK